MDLTPRQAYAGLMSILEVPILNDRYWGKVPELRCDGVMIDLEDSTPPARKEEARTRMLEAISSPEYLGGRSVIVRVNNLDTTWGMEDLKALSSVESDVIVCYPKVSSCSEVWDVRAQLGDGASADRLYLMIENAAAVMNLLPIAKAEGVIGLHFGYVDYAADLGADPFEGSELHPSMMVPRGLIASVAAGVGLFCSGGTLIPEHRDLDAVRKFVEGWQAWGYTTCVAISPSHVDVVNDVLAPSDGEIRNAEEVLAALHSANMNGESAAIVNGRLVTEPDARLARRLLDRSREPGSGSSIGAPSTRAGEESRP